jgi:hypothetical protein
MDRIDADCNTPQRDYDWLVIHRLMGRIECLTFGSSARIAATYAGSCTARVYWG